MSEQQPEAVRGDGPAHGQADSERALTAFVEARLGELRAETGQHFPGKLEFTSVRALAASWKDHPDYRQEWIPS